MRPAHLHEDSVQAPAHAAGGETASRTDAQALLFGADPTTHVVAVEVGDTSARLFLRTPEGIVNESRPFQPWLLAAEPRDLYSAAWTELEGEGLRFLAEFPSRAAMLDARRDRRGQGLPGIGYGSAASLALPVGCLTGKQGTAPRIPGAAR